MNKKINIFALVISSLLIFSACNFSSNSGTKNIEKDGKHFVISGDILTGGQRSASTSFTLTSSHIIEITATHNADGVAAGPTKATATVTGNKYSIVLDAPGEWNMLLTISVKNEKTNENDILYSVNGTINITDEGKILDPNGNQLDSSNINFTIRPDFGLSCPGSINLKIKDESGKIKKVSYSAELNGTSNTNSLSSVSEVTFENNEATISRNEVYPNSYKVKFNFDDDAGNTLYSCYEIVTVTAGFATDTWIGNGAHIRKDTETGTTEFVITNSLIEKFGVDRVPNTQMAFYNYIYDDPNDHYNYKFYLLDNVPTESPDAFTFGTVLDDGPNRDPCFTFDNDGRLYTYSRTYNNRIVSSIITTTNGAPNEYNPSMLDTDNNEAINAISFDRKTDKLFIYGNINKMYSCGKNELSNMSAATRYSISAEHVTDSALSNKIQSQWNVFTVYDNVLYVPFINQITTQNSQKASLFIAQKNLAEVEYNEQISAYNIAFYDFDIKAYDELFTDLPDDCSLKISDILVQDGSLYLLVKDIRVSDNDWSNGNSFRSRGAVVQIDFYTNSIRELGWTNEKMDVSNAGVYFKNRSGKDCYSDAELQNLFVLDGTKAFNSPSGELISKHYPDIYVPDGGKNLVSDAFYGPEKFIALKPKKLVIAEDGFAFYTNDDGALSYRNVNRVVIVDLEAFAIESCSDVSVKFAGGASSDFEGDYGRELYGNFSPDTTNFYYTNGSFTGNIYDNSEAEDDRLIVENGSLKQSNELRMNELSFRIKKEDIE